MKSSTEKINNAKRLAGALIRHADDANIISKLAGLLNYYPSQLKEDIEDLYELMLNNRAEYYYA